MVAGVAQNDADQSLPADPGPAPDRQLRRALLGRGHQLKARLSVGRQGLTDGFLAQVRLSFANADLLKIRIDCDDRDEAALLASGLAEAVPCHLVQRVGRVALLYRELAKDRCPSPGCASPWSRRGRSSV
jgi:RNA-binding protein